LEGSVPVEVLNLVSSSMGEVVCEKGLVVLVRLRRIEGSSMKEGFDESFLNLVPGDIGSGEDLGRRDGREGGGGGKGERCQFSLLSKQPKETLERAKIWRGCC